MMRTPEQIAREKIYRLLCAAGWELQDYPDFGRNATLGVAARVFAMASRHCDYHLFLEGRAAGVIEAMDAETTLSGFARQSETHVQALPEHLQCWSDLLFYHYEGIGEETQFCNPGAHNARSRNLLVFHNPQTVLEWIRRRHPNSLRSRIGNILSLVTRILRVCREDAINRLEETLAINFPRDMNHLTADGYKTFSVS